MRVCLIRTSSSCINADNSRLPGRFTIHGSLTNNVVNLKFTEHGRIHKTFNVTDIEDLFEIDNFEEYVNNVFLIKLINMINIFHN